MSEGTKTGIFWVIAVVMLSIAALVAWPKSQNTDDNIAGQLLFEKFTDPLAAASMKIITFNEEQGQLQTFEVRKDRESDLWTIPSRDGYPADALEHMRDAANSLVGLKILDIQTSNAEDHDDLGVSEPKLEDLEVGDEGVGRLVSFKDASQTTLASLIIGDALKDDPEKLYVRIPGQDPVYVVKLDQSPLTTNFQEWIEDDLLGLSSIDIADMEIKDYSAALNLGGQISLTRNYAATVEMDGSQWKLSKLIEYDPKNPMADPTPVKIADDQQLNKAKLDAMKNALDDLKIADVVRKPEGMSANLRANQDLLADKDAVGSLAQRGFYPVPSGPGGSVEILSANGELSVALKEGVKYIMRFGNIAGVTDSADAGKSDDDAEQVETGVNRYLLVTTVLDDSKFPPPELRPVPQSLEDLEAILNPPLDPPTADETDKASEKGEIKKNSKVDDEKPAEKKEPAEAKEPSEAKEKAPAEKNEPSADNEPEPGKDRPDKPEPTEKSEPAPSQPDGETESSGSGEATGKGEAQEPAAQKASDAEAKASDVEAKASESGDAEAKASDAEDKTGDAKKDDAGSPADAVPSIIAPSNEPPAAEKGSEAKPASDQKPADEELTEEEKMERLEAEQEKITKENQRKLDARKDKLEAAERQVRALNARFADWYYVIPEDTYSKLTIKRDELFEPAKDDASATGSPLDAAPQFNFPGLPGQPGN